MRISFYARKSPVSDRIGLVLVGYDYDQHTAYRAAPATFVEYDPANDVEPVVRMEVEEAQRLMDELWNCGLRPSEGSGSAGALAATQRHLDDMRKLVFKQ